MAYNIRYLRRDTWNILTHRRTLYTITAIFVVIIMLSLEHYFTLRALKKKFGDSSIPTTSTKAPLTVSPVDPPPHVTERPKMPEPDTEGKYYETCKQYLENGFSHDGVYKLIRANGYSFMATCVMDKAQNDSWMILQERSSDAVPFWNRTFEEYSNGFGDPSGDHWLGLSKIASMVQVGYKLRLKMEIRGERCLNTSKSDYYVGEWNFWIGPKSDKYRLQTAPINHGNFTFPLTRFAMYDRQSFSAADTNFAIKNSRTGGWWAIPDAPPFLALNGEYSCERMNSAYGLSVYVVPKVSLPHASVYIRPTWTRMMVQVL